MKWINDTCQEKTLLSKKIFVRKVNNFTNPNIEVGRWDFLIWFSFLRYRFFDVENENENENAISWHLLTSSVNFVLRCCTLAELRSRYRKYLLLSKSRENLPSSSSFLLLMANAALWTWIQQHSTTLQTKNNPKSKNAVNVGKKTPKQPRAEGIAHVLHRVEVNSNKIFVNLRPKEPTFRLFCFKKTSKKVLIN